MTTITEGQPAPAFDMATADGGRVTLDGFRGRTVVLYFYPRYNTPGCTIEAREFQKQYKAIEKSGAQVFGISADGIEAHCKFVDKLGLAFPLLADESHAVSEKYGVWVEKNMYGKKFMGIQRATFLVGADGKLARIWPKVSPKGHAKEVLEALRAL